MMYFLEEKRSLHSARTKAPKMEASLNAGLEPRAKPNCWPENDDDFRHYFHLFILQLLGRAGKAGLVEQGTDIWSIK